MRLIVVCSFDGTWVDEVATLFTFMYHICKWHFTTMRRRRHWRLRDHWVTNQLSAAAAVGSLLQFSSARNPTTLASATQLLFRIVLWSLYHPCTLRGGTIWITSPPLTPQWTLHATICTPPSKRPLQSEYAINCNSALLIFKQYSQSNCQKAAHTRTVQTGVIDCGEQHVSVCVCLIFGSNKKCNVIEPPRHWNWCKNAWPGCSDKTSDWNL